MSYNVTFKGQFVYPNTPAVLEALKVIDEEAADPDMEEMNALEKEDFKLLEEETTLEIDFSASIPATCWYGCQRVLYKMSTHAINGKIRCQFQGDPAQYIVAGDGY